MDGSSAPSATLLQYQQPIRIEGIYWLQAVQQPISWPQKTEQSNDNVILVISVSVAERRFRFTKLRTSGVVTLLYAYIKSAHSDHVHASRSRVCLKRHSLSLSTIHGCVILPSPLAREHFPTHIFFPSITVFERQVDNQLVITPYPAVLYLIAEALPASAARGCQPFCRPVVPSASSPARRRALRGWRAIKCMVCAVNLLCVYMSVYSRIQSEAFFFI